MRPALFILALLFSTAVLPASRSGIGWVTGHAEAVYHLRCNGKASPPEVATNGYEQKVQRVKDGWLISVKVSASPFKVGQTFTPGKLPSSLPLSSRQAHLLGAMLNRCGKTDDVVRAVVFFLHSELRYTARPDFAETPANVLRAKRASCVGAVRAAVSILRALRISCRPVIGIRFPDDGRESLLLEGGVLHAWLEVDYPSAGRVFTDVFSSINWVPQSFIVLRTGEGLSANGLDYLGGTLERLRQHDRVFFVAPSLRLCSLWERPSAAPPLEEGLISGKFLSEGDLPGSGKAVLTGNNSSVSMDLWNGNFFFTGLKDGGYRISIEPDVGKAVRRGVEIRNMDKRFIILYSHRVGEKEVSARK